jgi:hypothetical protein
MLGLFILPTVYYIVGQLLPDRHHRIEELIQAASQSAGVSDEESIASSHHAPAENGNGSAGYRPIEKVKTVNSD